MDFLQILFIILISIFVVYITSITFIYGILTSISKSYYKLPKKYNFLFTLFCWGFAIPVIIIGSDLTNNLFMFLAGASICFVGAAAQYKEKLTDKVHQYSARIGVISSQLSIIFDFKLYYVTILFTLISLLLLLSKIKNITFWIEILAFISISYVLYFQLFLNT